MGMPFGKPEYCYQNHPHRTVEDAMECDRFYSNRLREDDQIHRLENMMYRGQDTRFNPYPPNRQANMSETVTNRRGGRHYQIGNDHTDTIKQENNKDGEESRPGFLAGLFGRGNYYACALHHKHRTLEDAQECVRKLEERNKEAHQKRMGEKYTRGERDGLRLVAEDITSISS